MDVKREKDMEEEKGKRTCKLLEMDVKKEKDMEEEKGKEEELHEHTFSFWFRDVEYPIICKEAGTIYDSLQTIPELGEIAPKNKELVILADDKAISSHFPCCHITDLQTKKLIIKYITAVSGHGEAASNSSDHLNPNRGQMVKFSVKATGDTNIKCMVMKNPHLREEVFDVLVYSYKGQTVREALEQDGRFSEKVFEKNCVLMNIQGGAIIGMSRLVDLLHDQTFKVKPAVIKRNKASSDAKHGQKSTPKKTAGSKIPPQDQDACKPSTSTMNKPSTSTMTKSPTPNKRTSPTLHVIYQPIPNSEELLGLLRSQFKDLVEHMKQRKDHTTSLDVQQIFSEEYGMNSRDCFEVIRMRKLLELGNSVCQVRKEGRPIGSGFLLFGKYILTNAHVVTDTEMQTVKEKITVVFSYESLEDKNDSMRVKVVSFLLGCDHSGHKRDWALLEVCADINTEIPENSQPLLKHFGLVCDTDRGPICIIGHPKGNVKMVDPCFTIPCAEREQRFLPYVTRNFIFPKLMDPQIQTYDTCFSGGSSGSPVFDHNCKVVSMHTGGFNNCEKRFIEYSHPLSFITEQIIIGLVKNIKMNVLQEMIICGIPPVVMDNVKKIVESGNLKGFDRREGQEPLKGFFEFFSQKDEPTPIDEG